jgi:hypothetical protein
MPTLSSNKNANAFEALNYLIDCERCANELRPALALVAGCLCDIAIACDSAESAEQKLVAVQAALMKVLNPLCATQ